MVTKGFGGPSAKHTNPLSSSSPGGRISTEHTDILLAKILTCFCHSGLQSGENLYHQSLTSCNCHSNLCETHGISLQSYPRNQILGHLHAVTEELHCPYPGLVHFTPLPHQKGSIYKPEGGRMGPWLRASTWWGTQVHQDPGSAWTHWLTFQLCWQGDKN